MPTYDGTYKLAVEDGRVLIRDVEGGSQTTHVPLEIYSNYAAQGTLTDSRQLRLRTQPYLESNAANAYVTDMGIESGQTDNYFFITAPQKTANAGDRSTFVISKTSNVGIGTTDPEKPLHVVGDSWITGTLTASNIVGASPVTISSNLVMASGFTLTAGAIEPPVGSETTLKGGSTASITNSNAFPNFIFSRSSNVAANHGGVVRNTGRHAMIPDEDGRVWAAGYGDNGALGLGDETNRNVYTLVSALDGVANIVASATTNYSQVADYGTTILLDDTGNVWTCGTNGEGWLGHGDTTQRFIPTLVTTNIYSGVSITEVSTGGSASLVLDSTGQIWGCGYNSDYRIGNLSGSALATQTSFIPTYPGTQGEYTFTSIDVGEAYSLALQDNGRIWSTGAGSYGRNAQGGVNVNGWTICPNGNTINPALSEVSITQICTGEYHNVALDSTGNVWVSGFNDRGQHGFGDRTNRNYFERVTSNINVNQGVTIKKIGAAYQTSFALDTNGKMWGAGWGSAGAFGNSPYLETVTYFVRADAGPIADKSITDFALTSFMSTIARTSDNEYWVTGYGNFGNLGTGDTANRFSYTKLLDVNANPPPDYGYTRSLLLENTETGKGPSIELKNKNAVSSRIQMEDGASGKLNIGFVDASFDPKLSGGDGAVLEPFQDLNQSNTMTRGVTINQAGGTMVAGGSTSNIGLNAPIVNSGLPGTAQYGYGSSFWGSSGTNFVTTEGKVYFAGDNIYGAAGDGTTSNVHEWKESTPASSYPIVGWSQGVYHGMALDANGQVWSVGDNAYGKLGLGNTTNRTTWTAVSGTGNQAIQCAEGHSIRIKSDGTIETCGNQFLGRLGNASVATGNVTSFTASTSGSMSGYTAKSVWTGYASSFAIRSDNVLVACGYNPEGSVGLDPAVAGSQIGNWTAVTISNFSGETPVQVSSSRNTTPDRYFSMMITASGKIYGTGDGAEYATGLDSENDVVLFTQCTGDVRNVTVTRVATCIGASIALDSTGNVWITGIATANGQLSTSDSQEFTKVTLPAEFYSKTIVNVFSGQGNTFYVVDSEGTLWGVGERIRGLGISGTDGYDSKLFTKVPIYDVVPKEFKYTPTLTLENPNPDYGATVEFKNPNNRAFINLDDKTSTLRLGFVNNENNAGQFRGLEISPTHAPVNYPWCAKRANAWVYGAHNRTAVAYTSTYDPYNLWDGTNYTCPVDGVYLASFTFMLTNGNETGVMAYTITTQSRSFVDASTTHVTLGNSAYDVRNYSAMGFATAGEKIRIEIFGYNSATFDLHPNNGNAYIYLVTRC
jgi:alpha-tubulin suppressor-like RCC1 family protein